MKHHCPNCQRVLYNRRLSRCGFCGTAIPEALRFTAEEIVELDQRMDAVDEPRRLGKLATLVPSVPGRAVDPMAKLMTENARPHYCPACSQILYNRRLTHCGRCGAMIPENLRFTPEEIAILDREMAALAEVQKQRELAEKEAQKKAEAAAASGVDMTWINMIQ